MCMYNHFKKYFIPISVKILNNEWLFFFKVSIEMHGYIVCILLFMDPMVLSV